VRSHLEQADLFALASLTESYGMVFAEALAAGVPVVGNRVGGVPEIVRHGGTGLLCAPLSRKEWRRSLKRLITSAKTRNAMHKASLVERKQLSCWEEAAAVFVRGVRSLSGETAGLSL
jgi:glycosyltransferase involved in cell wall biosynthesis